MLVVLVNLLQWTYGVYTITDDKKYMNAKKVLTNPIVISVAIGLVLFSLNIKLPTIVENVFSAISGLNTPLAMMVTGVYLAQSDLISAIKNKEVYIVSFMRLLLIPIVTLFVLKLIPFGSNELKLAIFIASACPVGSNVVIFARQYDKNYKKGVENVCVSTLLSLLSLPFVVYLASIILG